MPAPTSTRHYTLTLDGTVQRLSAVLSNLEPNVNPYLRLLWLQPGGGNAGPIYVGSNADLTTSDYGFRLEAATGGVPPAPWSIGELVNVSAVRLSDLYVKGTNTEKLQIFCVPQF